MYMRSGVKLYENGQLAQNQGIYFIRVILTPVLVQLTQAKGKPLWTGTLERADGTSL